MSKEDMDRIHNEINSKLEEHLSKYGSLFVLETFSNKPILDILDFNNSNVFFIDVFRHIQDNLDCIGIRIFTGTSMFDFNSIAIRNGKSRGVQAKNLFEAIDFLCKHKDKIVMIIKKCLDAAGIVNNKTLMSFKSSIFSIEFAGRGGLSNLSLFLYDKELEFIEVRERSVNYDRVLIVKIDEFFSNEYKIML